MRIIDDLNERASCFRPRPGKKSAPVVPHDSLLLLRSASSFKLLYTSCTPLLPSDAQQQSGPRSLAGHAAGHLAQELELKGMNVFFCLRGHPAPLLFSFFSPCPSSRAFFPSRTDYRDLFD